jgi:hypothetical protein
MTYIDTRPSQLRALINRVYASIETVDEIKADAATLGLVLPDDANEPLAGIDDDLAAIGEKLAMAVVKMGEKS